MALFLRLGRGTLTWWGTGSQGGCPVAGHRASGVPYSALHQADSTLFLRCGRKSLGYGHRHPRSRERENWLVHRSVSGPLSAERYPRSSLTRRLPRLVHSVPRPTRRNRACPARLAEQQIPSRLISMPGGTCPDPGNNQVQGSDCFRGRRESRSKSLFRTPSHNYAPMAVCQAGIWSVARFP